MIMFDSLNRHMLPSYGCKWTHAPNFARLAEKTVTFDKCYIGSMPCMPARRELHTGRYNFLHRSWGPMEPYDDSMPEILKNNHIYTHLVSDHYHYWEDGGCGYHTKYNTWEAIRGQEGDPWKSSLRDPIIPECVSPRNDKFWRQDWVNREHMQTAETQPMSITFEKGLEFIKNNICEDNWFLQLETFDPHEPFFTQQKFKNFYPHVYKGRHFDWPPYGGVTETEDEVKHCRYEYSALLSMCDEYLGKVLDFMDEHDMWKDTMLIVNTDHGFLLGEHDYWAKVVMPFYNEIANIPLFIWDPRAKRQGEHCNCLVQTIDIAPTLLDFFNVEIPVNMQGKALKETLLDNTSVREAALFGIHGGTVNCTDGKYVYMRSCAQKDNQPLYNYTLMPNHMRCSFSVDELKEIELSQPFNFTKGLKTLKIPARRALKISMTGHVSSNSLDLGTMLFDIEKDQKQANKIDDPVIEEKMINHMIKLMMENDAPLEQYERLGIDF